MPATLFSPDSPFINSCAQSTAVAWSLGKATKLFDVRFFFYKHDVYKHIQAQVWWFFKNMLSIMLSLAKYCMLSNSVGSMNFSILTMIFSVKCCKTFSFWFIKNAAKEMLLTWGQVAYYIIVCITTTTHFEPDQVFFIRIHLGCLFNSRKTSTLFLPHCTKLFSD